MNKEISFKKQNSKFIFRFFCFVFIFFSIFYKISFSEFSLKNKNNNIEVQNEELIFNNRGIKKLANQIISIVPNKILVYKNNFKNPIEIKTNLRNPITHTNGKFMLLYDPDNYGFSVLQKNKKILTTKETKPVIGKINKHGKTLIFFNKEHENGTIEIYNKNLKKKFTYKVNQSNITDIEISENGKYMAFSYIIVSISEAKMSSAVAVIDISKKKRVAEIVRSDVYISNIFFNSDESLTFISDMLIENVTKFGKTKNEIKIENSTAKFLKENQYLILYKKLGSKSEIEIYDNKLRKIGKCDFVEELNFISCNKRNIAVSVFDKIFIVSFSGKTRKVIDIKDSREICLTDRYLAVLGASGFEFIKFCT